MKQQFEMRVGRRAIAAIQAAAGEGSRDYGEQADRADTRNKVLELLEQFGDGIA